MNEQLPVKFQKVRIGSLYKSLEGIGYHLEVESIFEKTVIRGKKTSLWKAVCLVHYDEPREDRSEKRVHVKLVSLVDPKLYSPMISPPKNQQQNIREERW